MRRKSERTTTKKGKSSPEKKEKVEKIKRTRTSRRKKHSTSSENDSADESSPIQETEVVVEVEKKTTQSPAKEESPEETQDRGEWHVKTAQSSSDTGEIQKLKICLTRPPSTPERTERSPRSKRKHSRAASSSDTTSIEVVEEKKKSKHRSKRAARESKDDVEKNHDSQGDEAEIELTGADKSMEEVTQSTDVKQEIATHETPMSTTNEETKQEHDKSDKNQMLENETESDKKENEVGNEIQVQDKSSDADTTVISPKVDHETETDSATITEDSQSKQQSPFVEKSDVLEIDVQESKLEITDIEVSESQKDDSGEITTSNKKDEDSVHKQQANITKEKSKSQEEEAVVKAAEPIKKQVSNEDIAGKSVSEEAESSKKENIKITNENDVVESSENIAKKQLTREVSTDSGKDVEDSNEECKQERIDSTQTIQSHEETLHNGQAGPIVINRKRRWGSRSSKLSSQKSITISTDILKEIIPDVKLVEFEEVIEEKKNKREVVEKIERPVLPKIVIDNTERAEQYRRENEDKDKENVKAKDSHLAFNRKISIVKENDSITARPPSPPRHKQSCILYITNLVRPFTLLQLKNLLQRTGRIVEDGFWIDKIKSKCYVKYEAEDQAVETRHALHGVTWPVSNPKTLQVDFSSQEAFDKAKSSDESEIAPPSTIPGTVEDWLREQDLKKERGEVEKPWEKKLSMREWDVGKNDKEKEKDRLRRDERPQEKRRYRTPDRSPEPARKFKKKEDEAPAKLLDDLFRKTKTTPCIYWLPLSAETIAIKEEQRRQHMAEHERRLQELRRERERRRH